MPKVTHVKKARKDNPVAKVGESYYWWKFRYGGKHYSKTYPRQSRLTQSEFFGQVYGLQEDMEDFQPTSIEEVEERIEDWAGQIEEIRDECEDKRGNMPDSLQDSPTGELLQERVDAMDQWADALRSISIDEDDDYLEVMAEVRELDTGV